MSLNRAQSPTVLDEARQIVQQREEQYGPPDEHHAATAAVWTQLLRRRGLLRVGAALQASDLGLLMAAEKLVREAHRPMRDNLVDACGYVACRERTLRPEIVDSDLEPMLAGSP